MLSWFYDQGAGALPFEQAAGRLVAQRAGGGERDLRYTETEADALHGRVAGGVRRHTSAPRRSGERAGRRWYSGRAADGHSYLRAVIGFTREAFLAGRNPASAAV